MNFTGKLLKKQREYLLEEYCKVTAAQYPLDFVGNRGSLMALDGGE